MDYCYKVLIVEDDQSTRHYISSALSVEGFECTSTDANTNVEEFVKRFSPDVILMDMGLRDGNGLRALKQIREWCEIPVIVVSARESEEDKVLALEYGADDYVQKPFGLNELLARIRAAIRRKETAGSEPEDDRRLTVCGLTIDYGQCRVIARGRDAGLTQIEFRIVCLLAENLGRVVAYDEIISRIWGANSPKAGQLLRVNIANIRRKICKKPSEPLQIKTVIGRGYILQEGRTKRS